MVAWRGRLPRLGCLLGGSQIGHQPPLSGGQMVSEPVQWPVGVLGRLIEEQVRDHLHLLRGTELPPDDRQDEGFFLFQVVILGDAGQDDGAEQMALSARDEHGPPDLLRQTALHGFQARGQAAVCRLAFPGHRAGRQ